MTQGQKLSNKHAFADRLRERRLSLGLTQRALASKAGVSPAAIGRMETEPAYVTTKPTILALANALECSERWLELGEGTLSRLQGAVSVAAKTLRPLTKSERAAFLTKSFSEFSEEDWERLRIEHPDYYGNLMELLDGLRNAGPAVGKL